MWGLLAGWLRPVVVGAAVLIFSWWGMMAVHEVGHVLGAWVTGGEVMGVSLSPFGFSYTRLGANPRPLVVAWSGPVVGSLLPVVVWGLWAGMRWRGLKVVQFFAGFCLIANGAYLGLGWIDEVGDAGELLMHGARVWQLVGFGVMTAVAGLWLWHGLGRWLGLGHGEWA